MTAKPKHEAVCRLLDQLIDVHVDRALLVSDGWEADDPIDRERTDDLMAVMQELDMLASLKRNFCSK